MIQDGFVANAWKEHISKISEIDCPEQVNIGTDDNYRLSLKDMAGIFIVHAFLMLVAIAIAMFDRWRKKKAE